MCTSYESNNRRDAFENYKDYFAPIFRMGDAGFETVPASFGMVPRNRIPKNVRPYDTMSARSDSIALKMAGIDTRRLKQ